MTHHTDAELLHALEESQSLFAAMLHEPRPTSELQKQMEQNRAAIDAARRDTAVYKRCDLCKDDGGYFYGRTGYEPCCVDAAAPQPPEAAPVQLPEPAAWVFKDRTWTEIRAMAVDHNGVPAYTEQQVRELLAQHGIK